MSNPLSPSQPSSAPGAGQMGAVEIGTPGPPPGPRHADPSGQAPHRYWDGQRWTEHVSR